jgi:ubiquitin C-terminal hydrolase
MMNERGETPLYDLCGVVYHNGSLQTGSYTAACLNSNSETGEWYLYKDRDVRIVYDLNQLVTSDAYVLVY